VKKNTHCAGILGDLAFTESSRTFLFGKRRIFKGRRENSFLAVSVAYYVITEGEGSCRLHRAGCLRLHWVRKNRLGEKEFEPFSPGGRLSFGVI